MKNPVWHAPANHLMLHLLAWFSTQDVRGLLTGFMQEHHLNNPYTALDQVLRKALEEVLTCLSDDYLVGPAFLALANHHLSHMDLPMVTSSIAIEGLVDARTSLFSVVEETAPALNVVPVSPNIASSDEANVLWAAVSAHKPLADYLSQLSRPWNGDICCGAQNLRAFFLQYLDLLHWRRPLPLFLLSLIQEELMALDWHRFALQVLKVESFCPCRCTTHADSLIEARIAWLDQLCWTVEEVVALESGRLPETLQTISCRLDHFAETCLDTHEFLEQVIKKGKRRETLPEQRPLFGESGGIAAQ